MKTEIIEKYIDNLIEVLNEPIKREKPLSKQQNEEIESRYWRQLKVKVKSYYNDRIGKNIVEFIDTDKGVN